MEEILKYLMFGVVQGMTELLPISSSAHIAIIEWLTTLKIDLIQETILNLGSTLAITFYFRNDIGDAFRSVRNFKIDEKGNLFFKILLTAIPVLIVAFLIKDYLETIKHNMLLIAISMIVMGIILYIVDSLSKKSISFDSITNNQLIIMSLAQVFSLIRGVSRSGITISTSRLLGIDRESALRLSFLMSLPVMFITSIYGLVNLLLKSEQQMSVGILVGFFASLITTYLSINLLFGIVKKYSFLPFAVYRIIVGILILVILYI